MSACGESTIGRECAFGERYTPAAPNDGCQDPYRVIANAARSEGNSGWSHTASPSTHLLMVKSW
jgi:hypothetical protein